MALTEHPKKLAGRARQFFAGRVSTLVKEELVQAVVEALDESLNQMGSAREMQTRRDTWIAFKQSGTQWGASVLDDWEEKYSKNPSTNTGKFMLSDTLELMATDSEDKKILSSRLALRIADKSNWEMNDFILRVRTLENREDLPKNDMIRPNSLAAAVVEQWNAFEYPALAWSVVEKTIQNTLADGFPAIYHDANQLLIDNGAMQEVDLRSMVRRTGGSPAAGSGFVGTGSVPVEAPPATGMGQATTGMGHYYADSAVDGMAMAGVPQQHGGYIAAGAGQPAAMPQQPQSGGGGLLAGGMRRMAAIRTRAQNALGGIRRIFSQQIPGGLVVSSDGAGPSPALNQAMEQFNADVGAAAGIVAYDRMVVNPTVAGEGGLVDSAHAPTVYQPMQVKQLASALKEQTRKLKEAAPEKAEKAIIEMVALMFQSIVNEERLSAGVRVWISRLQMPVLRLALSDPDFMENFEHPARRLIDHIGAVILGFDGGDMDHEELEKEIRRIVQVIEQYPETGVRVFELVYDEFQTFLEKYLTERNANSNIVSLAQQVEEKEALVIKYTIEFRDQLGKMPLRDEIRDFLFKTWSEVLAVATVRMGAEHEQTISLRRTATDLVWAASAKANRAERKKVIDDVPNILGKISEGMELIGLPEDVQTETIELISEALSDAFLCKTEEIDPALIAELSNRLEHLEDIFQDEEFSDLEFDAETVEMMLGIDASGLEIIAAGDAPDPDLSLRHWAKTLELGSWFTIDHNHALHKVQLCWRSKMGQLYLLASPEGHAFLLQMRAICAYFNAGLLLRTQEETLTMLATREALTVLEANPERLFSS